MLRHEVWLSCRYLVLACAALILLALPRAAGAAFVTFESGQVRPLALSPDGTRLFAVDTPDNRLEVLAVGPGGLTRVASVPVGLEPVAVAARSNTEVWVVNHLSDSVSVVDVGSTPPRVVRTLLVHRRSDRINVTVMRPTWHGTTDGGGAHGEATPRLGAAGGPRG